MSEEFDDFIELVKSNDRKRLGEFYILNKDKFIGWARKRFDVDEDTIVDVYQDAMVTLYQNIMDKKVTEFSVAPAAYLFGIGKNIMLKRNLKSNRVKLTDDISTEGTQALDYEIYDKIEDDHRSQLLKDALYKLKGNCREILRLFYYERNSIESIMLKMNYGSVQVVKTRKNQCMNKLKEIFAQSNDI